MALRRPDSPSGRSSARTVGGLSVGLLLGIVGGWVAGLLRAPKPTSRPRP